MKNHKVWVAKYDGKHIHIERNKRIPRKLKKFITIIYKSVGDDYSSYVICSPTYQRYLQSFEEFAYSVKESIDGALPTEIQSTPGA
jgi:hypothetical protein